MTLDGADNLRTSLDQLAGIVTGSLGLPELLTRVATYATEAVPGADGAGVTLLIVEQGNNVVEAIGASADFVKHIDEIQYVELNEGPCISAALERETVRSGSLGSESRWPRFGPRVGRLGVHSVLSLPLLLPEQLVGAINVYAHEKNVFDSAAAELGERFAAPAAVAVHNAHVLSQARTVTAQLQAALATRPVIDQAIGLLRGRSGISAEEAFERLRATSQSENVKLSAVAQRTVDEAVRRANSRREQT
jgi:GAF domain-containing protein